MPRATIERLYAAFARLDGAGMQAKRAPVKAEKKGHRNMVDRRDPVPMFGDNFKLACLRLMTRPPGASNAFQDHSAILIKPCPLV